MTYREHPAPAALSPWLDCGWERSGVAGAPVRVLPDGCIDIVWTEGRGARVVGPNTTAFVVPLVAGVRVAGLRIRPGGAPPLLGIDAVDVRDGSVALEQVWDDAGRRLEQALEDDGGDGAVAWLVAALRGQARRSVAPDPLVRAAVGRLRDPLTRVEAAAAGYADQAHFAHDCRALAGVSPGC